MDRIAILVLNLPRSIFGLETAYTAEEIDQAIHLLEIPMSRVSKTQYGRHRYWVLKYLESRIGKREEALVLLKRRNNYIILMKGYMIECDLPLSEGMNLKPEDLIQVKIQHVNARKGILSVFMG